ncbi:MAG: hypothetical protein HZA90_17660 [Verrucomicrobia bacterium]|nr:hypothetical protein [Verrucomicrobiota bacterium]
MIIYGAGVVTGLVVLKNSSRAPMSPLAGPMGSLASQQRFLERMKKELRLTPDQIKRLELIFRESGQRMRAWWEIIGPEMQAELKDVREKIRHELTPEQREKFEQLLKRRHAPGANQPGEQRPYERRSQGGRGGARSGEAPSAGKLPATNPAAGTPAPASPNR